MNVYNPGTLRATMSSQFRGSETRGKKSRSRLRAPNSSTQPGDDMKHSMRFGYPSHQAPVIRGATILLFFLLAVAFSGEMASAQTGFTGIFGGGPFYKNAANNITEIENSGFTEAIVWSVEVNSVGDLNFNGEFPLTSNGVYIGDQTHSDFAANMALLKQG